MKGKKPNRLVEELVMREKNYFCFSQRLAAWLMLHNVQLLYTTKNIKNGRKLVFVFEPDSKIETTKVGYSLKVQYLCGFRK